jgi:hypothetical protein
MRGCVRTALAGIVGVLLSGGAALADGYTLNFAINMKHGEQATGSVECRFDDTCTAPVDSLKMTLRVTIRAHATYEADVNLEGQSGCCLFEGAMRRLNVYSQASVSQHRLFAGREADEHSLVLIYNKHVGDLYLKFQIH